MVNKTGSGDVLPGRFMAVKSPLVVAIRDSVVSSGEKLEQGQSNTSGATKSSIRFDSLSRRCAP